MNKKHEVKIDITPAVDAVERIIDSVGVAVDKGLEALKDVSQRPIAADKWVSKDNPYRRALYEIVETLAAQERTAEDDARAHGRMADGTKPLARVHQEGRAHAFRDARSLVQRYWPPEKAGIIKPGE